MNLKIEGECWHLPFCKRELSQAIQQMFSVLQNRGQQYPDSLELLLVRDGVMSVFNQQYMGCLGPTNILSFPADNDFLGSLMLDVDAVYRECCLYAQKPGEHCLRLLAHGLAHLAGYDHGQEMDKICATMVDQALSLL